jgi:acetyltransferase-like isoleucine patch superfamily enzyme
MKLPRIILMILKRFRCQRIFKRWTEAEQALDLMPGYCISDGDKIELGVGVHFGNEIYIDARGGVAIGSNVIFAPNVSILSYNHDFRNPDWKPYSPDFVLRKVTIGDHCWFGRGCMILPGAEIGDNCVIGAGSIVSGAIPSNSIVAGNPAKVIGQTKYNVDAKPYMVIHGKMRRFG